MLYEDKDLSELHYMKHRHDDNKDYVDYQKNILSNKLSPYLYRNDLMNSFLNKLQPLHLCSCCTNILSHCSHIAINI